MKRSNEWKFRKLWAHLAETGGDDKSIAWDELKLGNYVRNNCPACEEVKDKVGNLEICRCKECPVTWGVGYNDKEDVFCMSIISPFYGWKKVKSISARKKYALIISQLPWVRRTK